jgi:predicted PurR-regulated permease PerM
LAFFQEGGGILKVVWVLVVFSVVQAIEGYLLTPRIMGDRTGLHPVAIIVAVFFWGTALSGILGMVLAIPLTAFLVVFWRLAKERYIPEIL